MLVEREEITKLNRRAGGELVKRYAEVFIAASFPKYPWNTKVFRRNLTKYISAVK